MGAYQDALEFLELGNIEATFVKYANEERKSDLLSHFNFVADTDSSLKTINATTRISQLSPVIGYDANKPIIKKRGYKQIENRKPYFGQGAIFSGADLVKISQLLALPSGFGEAENYLWAEAGAKGAGLSSIAKDLLITPEILAWKAAQTHQIVLQSEHLDGVGNIEIDYDPDGDFADHIIAASDPFSNSATKPIAVIEALLEQARTSNVNLAGSTLYFAADTWRALQGNSNAAGSASRTYIPPQGGFDDSTTSRSMLNFLNSEFGADGINFKVSYDKYYDEATDKLVSLQEEGSMTLVPAKAGSLRYNVNTPEGITAQIDNGTISNAGNGIFLTSSRSQRNGALNIETYGSREIAPSININELFTVTGLV